MTENKRFQKRYIEKNNKVYDTFKEMFITDELNSDSLLNVISHLNGLGEMIDIKIKQGRYCMEKYKELEDENEQLKKENKELKEKYDAQRHLFGQLNSDYNNLREENKELKQLNIPIEEIEETVIDYQGRITAIYYKE